MLTSKEICNNANNILSSFDKNRDVSKLTTNLITNKNYKFLTPKLAGDLVAKYHDRNQVVDNLEDENQLWWYKLLNKFDSPLIKPVTYNNERLNNIILPHYLNALDEVLEHASQLYEEEKEEQQKQQQQSSQGDSGESDNNGDNDSEGNGNQAPKLNLGNCKPKKKGGDKGDSEQEQQDSGDSEQKLTKEQLEDFINKKVKEVSDKVNEEFKDAPTEVLQGGTDAGDESDVVKTASGMSKIEAIQRKLKFNKEPLNRFIKKTINLFKNNMSAPQGYEMLGLMEADVIEELHDLYNLGLPEYFFKDIYTLEEKHSTVVDCFFDISGSIHSTCI